MKKLYTYRIFNLLVQSEYCFKALSPINSNVLPNLYVKFLSKPITISSSILLAKKNIVLYADGFHFSVGNVEIVYLHNEQSLYLKHTEDDALEAYLLGPMMALIGAYNRYIPLHAAGITLDHCAMLILGKSGAGKSTMLVELVQKYAAQYFSDDMVWISQQNKMVQAIPSFPSIKLWEDAVDRLHVHKEKAIHHKINKFYIDLSAQYSENIQKPSVLIVIKTSSLSDFNIEEITGSKKFLLLQSYIYRKPWIEEVFKNLVFSTLTELCKTTKMIVLTRPLMVNPKAWDKTLTELLKQLKA